MQTKKQIRQLLEEASIRPNKRFGQNFLIDANLMRILVDSASLTGDDMVLEVGCATGSLTEELAKEAGLVITVEIDKKIAEIAEGQLSCFDNVEIISADVLSDKHTINPDIIEIIRKARQKFDGRFLMVSNLPYSAATPLMLNLVCGPVVADAMYVTVQKEVAERMTAKAGSKDYGILSVILACFGDLKVIRKMPAAVFWPMPKVESAMISFVRSSQKAEQVENSETLASVVSLFMQHRRKMVKAIVKYAAGSLAEIDDWQELFEKSGIEPRSRPQTILPENFLHLANLCRQLEMLRQKQE
jgi:16S rRNA (adenine1518-N6/adenine1519-N6)-dimethyltransferase